MLENILNNVNATETPKPKTEVKKTTDDVSTSGDSFKNLLQKNLSEDKTEKTQETPKSTKIDALNAIHNDTLHPVGTKPSDIDTLKHNSKNPSSPTKELLNASLNDKIEKNALAKSSPTDIKSNPKTPQNTEKKLSDIKTLADEKNLKPENIKLDKNTKNPSSIKADESTPTSKTNTPTTPTTLADSIEAQNKKPSDTQKLTTQNLLDQKIKTSTAMASGAKKDENKPLSSVLNTIDEKELKTRKKFNQNHKIEYKTEDKTEKIAIIERGKNLPKNIVEPKIYQEKRAAKLEALNEKMEANAKNQTLQEAINGAITKDIKLKDNTKDEKIENSKEDAQKKTKKSGNSSKSKPQINATLNESAKISPQDQNKQIQNQIDQEKSIEQEKTTLSSIIQKNKKTTDSKEVEKTKDKANQDTSIQKDSTSTLGIMPKNELLYKSVNAKQTIKNFAQSLSEEIKNYKPPMSKLSLELNPEKLGKVELTIKQIGNSLHVSVVSNNQAIALFLQNQVDLRQNLAMIGFSGVDLNFSSQDGSQNSQNENQDSNNQKRNKNSLKEYEEVKNISQTPYDTMEIVLPRYA